MCKKFLLYGGGILTLGFLVFGTAVFGHLRQGVSWVRHSVQEQIPVEIELERARSLIEETGPQVRECKRVIAERQVEIRGLEAQLGDMESKQTVSREKLKVHQTCLAENRTTYNMGGREVARVAVESDALRILERVKTHDQIIASKRERLNALEKSLAYAQKTLESVLTEKANLEAQLDLLETKLRQTEAMKAATSNIAVDSSNLAKAKDILSNQSRRLDVVQQMIVNDQPLIDDMDVAVPTSTDVSAQIADYLGGKKAPAKAQALVPETVEAPTKN
jgi:chromosome segregation ATPase